MTDNKKISRFALPQSSKKIVVRQCLPPAGPTTFLHPPTRQKHARLSSPEQHPPERASMSIHQRLAVCQTCLKSSSSFTKKLRYASTLLGRTHPRSPQPSQPSQPSQLWWCMAWSQAWRRAREQRVQPRGVPHLQPASASLSAAAGEHLPPLPSPPQPLALHLVCVCPRDAGGGGADTSEAAWPAKATLQQRRGCRCAPIPA